MLTDFGEKMPGRYTSEAQVFFNRKTPSHSPSPAHKALEAELSALLKGLDYLASQFSSGSLTNYPPVLENVSERVEPLFLRTSADGKRLGIVYYFTKDFKGMDPNAQIHLINLFGGFGSLHSLIGMAATAKDAAEREKLTEAAVSQVDRLRAQTTIFLRHLARFDLGTEVLTGKISPEDFRASLTRQNEADNAVIRRLIDNALIPKVIVDTANATWPTFLISIDQDAGEDQPKRFNGVWLPPDMADKYLAHIAKAQTQNLFQRDAPRA